MKTFIIAVSALLLMSGCGGDSHDANSTVAPKLLADVASSDILILPGSATGYQASRSQGVLTVTDAAGKATPIAANIKRVVFADATLALDIDGVPGEMYRLYQAAFDRKPDLAGLGVQIAARERFEDPLQKIAQSFIDSAEFASKYGNPNDEQYITQLYTNVLHRTSDSLGFAAHLNGLRNGLSRTQLLINFSESPENRLQVSSSIQDGIVYVPSSHATRCIGVEPDPLLGGGIFKNTCQFAVEVNYCVAEPNSVLGARYQCAAQPSSISPTGTVYGKDTLTLPPGGTQRNAGQGGQTVWLAACISRQSSQADGATAYLINDPITNPTGGAYCRR